MNKIFTVLVLLGIFRHGIAQQPVDTQMRNARATGYAIVAARNPGKIFSIYVIPWDKNLNHSLEYNANTQINSGWHAQAAVKGNFFDQAFDGSDFSQYSSVVLSEEDFNTYKSSGTQWWIICSTLPAFSNSSLTFSQNGNVSIKNGDNNNASLLSLQSGAYSYETTTNRIQFAGTEVPTTANPLGVRKDIQWLIGQEAGLNFTFRYGASETEFVRLTNDGKMGIGTSSPDAKLTVKGDIHTREVRVDVTGGVGPDYVFEKDYNLLPLSEVENYIKQNKHLPEIPSAKDMEQDGLNLKEMNLLLLKKVEELTLHLIEKEKRDQQQSEQITFLQRQLQEVQKKQ